MGWSGRRLSGLEWEKDKRVSVGRKLSGLEWEEVKRVRVRRRLRGLELGGG